MRSAGTVDNPIAIEFFLFLQQFFDSVLGNIIRIHCYRDGNKLVGSKGKSTLFDLLGGLNLLVDILISEFCHLSFGIGLGNTLDARSPWLLPVTIEERSGPYRYGRQKEERKKHQTDLFHEVSEQKLISRNTLRPNLIPVKQGWRPGEMLALDVNYMLNHRVELNADHGGLGYGYKSSPSSRGKEKETVYRRDSARLRKDFHRQDVHCRVEVRTGLGRRKD